MTLLRRFAPSICWVWGIAIIGAALPASASSTTATTLAVTSAGAPVTSIVRGAAITLTATVSVGSTPVSPGLVKFCDATALYCTDVHIVGTAQLNTHGAAVLHLAPGRGSHEYKAVFVGTNAAATSTSNTSSVAVTGRTTTASSIAATGGGSDYTLIATVAGAAAAGPTGNVSFFNLQDELLGTGTLGASSPAFNLVPGPESQANYDATSMVTADFNGDGQPDLVLTDPGSNVVNILLGDGLGKFTAGANVATGPDPNSVVTGDFNADGNVDLAVANRGGTTVTILLGHGNGTFTAAASPIIGTEPVYLTSADFNGDGNADLAVAYDKSEIVILFGKGDGTFSAGPITPLSGVTFEDNLVAEDFNGDGKIDLVTSSGEGAFSVLLGNGDGTFSSVAAPQQRTGTVFVGDFNQDGKADVVLLSGSSNTFEFFPGNGDGTFGEAVTTTIGGDLTSLAVADFNDDGKPDLVILDAGNFDGGTGALRILLGNGDGTFTASTVVSAHSNGYSAVTGPILATDLNGDSTPDVVGDIAFGGVSVFETETRAAVASITGVNVPLSSNSEDVYAVYDNDSNNMGSQSTYIELSAFSASLSPSSLTFTPTRVGGTGGYRQATLTNTGNGPLDTSIHIHSQNNTFYIRDQTCGATLDAGASCTFNVAFTPSTYGNQSGDVTAEETTSSDNLAAYLTTELSGVGLAEAIKLTPTELTFGTTVVGTTAGYQRIVLSNPGTLPLTLRSIAITNTTDFYSWGIRNQLCGSTVAPGATCSFEVAFRPTRTGAITAEVSVDDMLGSWQQKIPLSGTGK